MKLTDDEKAMLDGKEGPAKQKAMDLLVRYGNALGAERLVDTNNVCGTVVATNPFMREFAAKAGGFDAVFSEFNLDSSEVVEIPMVKAHTCQLIQSFDQDLWEIQGISRDRYELSQKNEAFSAGIGVQLMSTCTPYQVGNVPVKGEHCAWMESSAVVYINSVLGARSNVEGRESTGAAMLTGKIPYWGYHLDENRLGTDLVEVEWDVQSMMDWGLLGYYIGEVVGERIPVLSGVRYVPNLYRIKHFGASAASSGGVELFHIPGITAEANSLEEAFGKKKPKFSFKFGKAERQKAYEHLNHSAKDKEVDFIMLGCPHASIEQIWEICKLLNGKRVNRDTMLWIFTPRSIKQLADRNGYSKIISDAGGVLMSDSCPAVGQLLPKGTKVVATDSAKQAHYLPAIMGVQTWFGLLEDCINAAITGKWSGELR
ncbi:MULTISPECIES: aconitase X catalytic domain-containing protein [unclassified Paenibacillus]|uniref:aconitase X n=1 Tax=unclassified Paenibacillus TaxID=185978 RepID=UPI002117DEB6|nr:MULTISPECIES: aconitase X catalytic domain-containing protein [unclassified Paenibacillus]